MIREGHVGMSFSPSSPEFSLLVAVMIATYGERQSDGSVTLSLGNSVFQAFLMTQPVVQIAAIVSGAEAELVMQTVRSASTQDVEERMFNILDTLVDECNEHTKNISDFSTELFKVKPDEIEAIEALEDEIARAQKLVASFKNLKVDGKKRRGGKVTVNR